MLDIVLQLPVCSKATEGNITLYRKISGDDGIVICLKKNGKYVWKFQDGKTFRTLMSTQSCGIKDAFCFLIDHQPVRMSHTDCSPCLNGAGSTGAAGCTFCQKLACYSYSVDLGPSICLLFVGDSDERRKKSVRRDRVEGLVDF